MPGSSFVSIVATELFEVYLPSPAGEKSTVAAGTLGSIPLWIMGPSSASLLTASAVTLFAASALTPTNPDLSGDKNAPLRLELTNDGFHLSMWSSYKAYAIARKRTEGSNSGRWLQLHLFHRRSLHREDNRTRAPRLAFAPHPFDPRPFHNQRRFHRIRRGSGIPRYGTLRVDHILRTRSCQTTGRDDLCRLSHTP